MRLPIFYDRRFPEAGLATQRQSGDDDWSIDTALGDFRPWEVEVDDLLSWRQLLGLFRALKPEVPSRLIQKPARHYTISAWRLHSDVRPQGGELAVGKRVRSFDGDPACKGRNLSESDSAESD